MVDGGSRLDAGGAGRRGRRRVAGRPVAGRRPEDGDQDGHPRRVPARRGPRPVSLRAGPRAGLPRRLPALPDPRGELARDPRGVREAPRHQGEDDGHGGARRRLHGRRRPHRSVEDLHVQVRGVHRGELPSRAPHRGTAAPHPGPLHGVLLGARSTPAHRAPLRLLQGIPPLPPRHHRPGRQRGRLLLSARQRGPRRQRAARAQPDRQGRDLLLARGRGRHVRRHVPP